MLRLLSVGLPRVMLALDQYPSHYGFRMPAEWEPHKATWLAWPHETTDWPGKFEAVIWIYGEIVRHLAQVEKVHILVENADAEAGARDVLAKCHVDLSASVRFFKVATDRSWTRDFCPIFIKSDEADLSSAYADVVEPAKIAALNWHFNGWAKYDNWQKDDAATGTLVSVLDIQSWTPTWNGQRVVLEGGSIDVNGQGTILTTEECLLSSVQARNPGVSRGDYEKIFRYYLGARHTLWLHDGIAGDDTHGHVDDIARFVDPHTVVVVSEPDPADVNHVPLLANEALLRKMQDQHGEPLRVVTLPMPEPVYFDGQRLPASYANFYIANQIVLVPTFNDANDRVALNTLAELFPDRKVIGIASKDLVLGLGTLHCMTQQQPAL
jgi:agmatine deiminase